MMRTGFDGYDCADAAGRGGCATAVAIASNTAPIRPRRYRCKVRSYDSSAGNVIEKLGDRPDTVKFYARRSALWKIRDGLLLAALRHLRTAETDPWRLVRIATLSFLRYREL